MTEGQYERANQIRSEMASINNLLGILSRASAFKLDPPTRESGLFIQEAHGDKKYKTLTEGEVVCINNALIARLELLEYEFKQL